MNIVQITPGAGGMYCGNCLRDNALVIELRRMGHETLMIPLYLPLTLDEPDQSADTPIFFGGINVYLEQKSRWFRSSPRWIRNLLASPALLRRASGRSAKTRPEDVGAILISMLRGADGNQARELDELCAWLKDHSRPDVVCLSNALLLGMAQRLKQELGIALVCMLQGEDSYLDSLSEPYREPAWQLLREKAAHTDLFIAPNRYFADLMAERLSLPPDKVHVVPDGIQLDGYGEVRDQKSETGSATLGYFARMCQEKGLGLLVDAFIAIHKRNKVANLTLKVGGGCGPGDEAFVDQLQERLRDSGLIDSVSFHPNLDRANKIEFLRSLDVFSVPAIYGEAFGLYLVEANAASVPVVQPRTASFPELIEATGGGILCDPDSPESLADAIESLLLDREKARALGVAGQKAVFEKFSAEAMAQRLLSVLKRSIKPDRSPAS